MVLLNSVKSIFREAFHHDEQMVYITEHSL